MLETSTNNANIMPQVHAPKRHTTGHSLTSNYDQVNLDWLWFTYLFTCSISCAVMLLTYLPTNMYQ